MGEKKDFLTQWKGLASLVLMYGVVLVLLDWGRVEVKAVARASNKAVELDRILVICLR